MDFMVLITIWAAAIGVVVFCIHEAIEDRPNT